MEEFLELIREQCEFVKANPLFFPKEELDPSRDFVCVEPNLNQRPILVNYKKLSRLS